MTDEPLVLCEGAESEVATVTINRPRALNALSAATFEKLRETFQTLERSPGLRCVILTGAGEKAFVAGADIKSMEGMGPAEAEAFVALGHSVCDAIEAFRTPVIAAVNGFALGGGTEIALACDFIVASQTATFGLPEVTLGLIPGFGGTQRLGRRVGLGRARELTYSARSIDAAEALRIGLVNAVHPAAELLSNVRALAATIATRSPHAVAVAKQAIRLGADRPLPDANAIERERFAALFTTEDQREGVRAFLEKRAPKWRSH